MELFQDDNTWAEATYAVALGERRPTVAVSVVGEGGIILRFESIDEVDAFAEAIKRGARPPKKGRRR